MFDKTYVRELNKDEVIAGCIWHIGEYVCVASHIKWEAISYKIHNYKSTLNE